VSNELPDPLHAYDVVLATAKQVQAERDAFIRHSAQVEILEQVAGELATRVEHLREGIDEPNLLAHCLLAMAEAAQTVRQKIRRLEETP